MEKSRLDAANTVWWSTIFSKTAARIVDPQTVRLLLLRRAEQKRIAKKGEEILSLKAEIKKTKDEAQGAQDRFNGALESLSSSCSLLKQDLVREHHKVEQQDVSHKKTVAELEGNLKLALEAAESEKEQAVKEALETRLDQVEDVKQITIDAAVWVAREAFSIEKQALQSQLEAEISMRKELEVKACGINIFSTLLFYIIPY